MLCDNLDIINCMLIYFLFYIQGRQKCLNIYPYEGQMQLEFNGVSAPLVYFIDNI